jgi:hypothetical protein
MRRDVVSICCAVQIQATFEMGMVRLLRESEVVLDEFLDRAEYGCGMDWIMATGLLNWLNIWHEGMRGLVRIDQTPDDELSDWELVEKRRRAAELKRLHDKFDPEWDRVFGRSVS